LDIDSHGAASGLDALHELERRLGPLPDTAVASTPTSGERRLFRVPRLELGAEIETVYLVPGLVQVRARGSHSLPPPPRAPRADTDALGDYTWHADAHPEDLLDAGIGLAPLPERWIAELLAKSKEKVRRGGTGRARDGLLMHLYEALGVAPHRGTWA